MEELISLFIDSIPNTDLEQRSMIKHCLRTNGYSIDLCDFQKNIQSLSILAFTSFLQHPDDLTVVLLPNFNIQLLVQRELSKLLDHLRRTFFWGGLIDSRFTVKAEGLVLHNFLSVGIRFKSINPSKLAGLPKDTQFICFDAGRLTARELSELRNITIDENLSLIYGVG
jgi:hypothetical protein